MWQYKVGINANIANLFVKMFVKMSISQSQSSVTHVGKKKNTAANMTTVDVICGCLPQTINTCVCLPCEM